MKKIKLLPSVLMLVLCIGVLGLGVYAATPATNTITGQITVNSANAQVEISAYVGGDHWQYEQVLTTKTTRTGYKWNIPNSVMSFDLNEYEDISEVVPKFLEIRIKNKSQKAIGAYFYKEGTQLKDGFADVENILLQTTANNIEEGKSDEVVANIKLTSYSYIGKAGSSAEEVSMFIKITPAELFETTKTGKLNLSLNIEEYKAETTENGLDKLADDSEENYYYSSDTAKIVVGAGGFDEFFVSDDCIAISGLDGNSNVNTDYMSIPATLQDVHVFNNRYSGWEVTFGSVYYDVIFISESFNIGQFYKIEGVVQLLASNVNSLTCGGESMHYDGIFEVPAQITELSFFLNNYTQGLVDGLFIPAESTLECDLPSVSIDSSSGYTSTYKWTIKETGEVVTEITDRDFDATYDCTTY